MEQKPTAILLCGNRIALPVMRNLVFQGQVVAIVIPGHCTEFTEQVQLLLKDSSIDIITVTKNDYSVKIQELIKEHAPVIGIMFNFSFRLTASIYTMPSKGFFNIHAGPLPAYRGPDPIFRQVKNKEPYAFVTIHKVDAGLDSGEIVMTDKIRLSDTDTHGILATKLAELAAGMVTTLMKLADFATTIPSRPQDHSKANYYPKQTAAEISIDWNVMNAGDIIALIHACNPWNKGAVTKLNQNIIRLLDARIYATATGNSLPGTILSVGEQGVAVKAPDAIIMITMIYCDEGFLMAARLSESGIIPGYRFDAM